MPKFKIFRCILMADETTPYAVFVPAVDETAAREYCKGNGEIIAVDDQTGMWPISANEVLEKLCAPCKEGMLDQTRANIVMRLVQMLEDCVD